MLCVHSRGGGVPSKIPYWVPDFEIQGPVRLFGGSLSLSGHKGAAADENNLCRRPQIVFFRAWNYCREKWVGSWTPGNAAELQLRSQKRRRLQRGSPGGRKLSEVRIPLVGKEQGHDAVNIHAVVGLLKKALVAWAEEGGGPHRSRATWMLGG